VVELAEAAASPPFLGVVLLGSFARGEADDLSDVDFTVQRRCEPGVPRWRGYPVASGRGFRSISIPPDSRFRPSARKAESAVPSADH
jgi:hypothetical protein